MSDLVPPLSKGYRENKASTLMMSLPLCIRIEKELQRSSSP